MHAARRSAFRASDLLSRTRQWALNSPSSGRRISESSASAESTSENQVLVTPQAMHDFCQRCMESVGARPHHAHVWAELMVAADIRGHYSHGMNRLDFYLNDVEVGNAAVDKEPEIVKETVATALVNGNNLLGPVVGQYCMDVAIQKAKEVGIGWVSARGSNHYGIAGWYAMRAMDQGLIGMSFCNASPNMVPPRGRVKSLGTNPIAVAARGVNGETFVLDMATTAVAKGKVELMRRLGKPLPYGWGVDNTGRVSTDTEAVFTGGGLCPLGGAEENGGYKGFGLAMMVDLFSGILSGSEFGNNIRSWKIDGVNGAADLGQCYVAVDPKVFAPGFEERLSKFMQLMKGVPKVEGGEDALTAGDPERFHTELCENIGGIPYHDKQIAFADAIAEKYKVEPFKRKPY